MIQKIDILNRTITITEKDTPQEVHELSDADGYFSLRSEEIRVFKHLANNRKLEVLLHEMFHAITDTGNLDCYFKDEPSMESFMIMFTRIFIDTVRRNNIKDIETLV